MHRHVESYSLEVMMRVLSAPITFSWLARLLLTFAFTLPVAVLTTAAASAATHNAYPPDSAPIPPIATMLRPDGSLQLPTGFRGSLDARGWQLVSDANEPPRFAPAAAAASSSGSSENTGHATPRVAGDERWVEGFGVGGLSGNAYAIAVDGTGKIYVGGEFKTAGNIVVNHIAKWDGANWSALGNGLNMSIWALAIDGSNNLYVGGDFTLACADWNCSSGTILNHIAKWNPSGAGSWSALGKGLDGSVAAIALSATAVYVGGSFMRYCTPDCTTGPIARNIAKWDLTGNTWSPLSFGLNAQVSTLALDGNSLYVGGHFTGSCGSDACSGSYVLYHIGKWDISGARWVQLGRGLDQAVKSLLVDSNHILYAGGLFMGICTVDWCLASSSANHIAKWDPSGSGSWSTLGQGVDRAVRALAMDSSGKLYLGGQFINICNDANCDTTSTARHLALWNPSGGGNWSGIGTGTSGDVWGLVSVAPNMLYGVGSFYLGNGQVMNNVLSVNTGSGAWSALGTGNGLSGFGFNAVASDSDGNVYVGGNFSGAGGLRVNNIAMWSPSLHGWSALGYGVDDGILALAVDVDNNLYVGGSFLSVCTNWDCSAGTRVNHIAKWSPGSGSWSALSYGMETDVLALALDGNGNLFAGGYFQNVCTDQNCIGTTRVNYISRWNASGGNWLPLASGLNNSVLALAVGSGNRVYAGGDFVTQCSDLSCTGGTRVNHAAVWDGSGTGNWAGMAKGFDLSVNTLAVDYANNVYAGGDFYNACTVDDCSSGMPVNLVAKWAAGGSNWSPLQNGLNDSVRSLAVDGNNNVYVSGYFTGICTSADCTISTPVNRVAQWNPSGAGSWSSLGSGTNDFISAMARHYGDLYVIGGFAVAGNKASVHFGEYTFNSPPTITDITKTGHVGTTIVFTATDFASVMTDLESETLVKIKVVSLPAAATGTLRLNGTAVTLNQEIALADLGKLSFVPSGGWQGTTSFIWNGADSNGYASASAKVNITLTGSQLFLPSIRR